jgi:hypothetical protein
MNIRTVALAIVALLSTAAGCARPGLSQAADASHPVVSFATPAPQAAAATPSPEHQARFEIEVQPPVHIDPAGASRR